VAKSSKDGVKSQAICSDFFKPFFRPANLLIFCFWKDYPI